MRNVSDKSCRENKNTHLYSIIPPPNRGPVEEHGGGSFAGTFERKEKHIWVNFFDPEAIKILSLGAIWNFGKGTGLS